jgi:DNA invertase Pin-like site-specific DNA recombinase
MANQVLMKNAVAAIRVSTMKQGIDGDSPDDQKDQIEQHAAVRGIKITKYFVFLESASKEQQPMQEAIDYCIDPKNNIQHFIVKSIDRFTRGGSFFYDTLKNQLDDCNVSLVDIYGVIGNQKINTLEHLGVKYKWSEYSPTKKSEMLEAERAKDEVRDIQTRMIGAQIRYARMGYWVRRPLYGFDNVHIETRDGKRCVLKPNDKEAPFVIKLFEMRARNNLDDMEIVDKLNMLGYRSREHEVRDKNDRTKVVDITGGEILNLKQMWRMVENPVYAGINPEKWTQDKPVKCMFDGLVSIELFNAANRGKLIITEDNEGVHIHKRRPPEHLLNKGVKNSEFPYKRVVMCPECENPLYGSASRGKLGKYYPAYHCDHRGHYFRVVKKEFDQTIEAFVKNIKVSPEYIDELMSFAKEAFVNQQLEVHKDAVTIDLQIARLRSQIRLAVDKIKYLNSESAIKYMEEDITKLEAEIGDLMIERQKTEPQEPTDIEKLSAYVRHYLEHLEELLLNYSNPILQAKFFGVIFNNVPTHQTIVSGTPDVSKITGVNKIFASKNCCKNLMAGDEGFEPPIAEPESAALPLGQSPVQGLIILKKRLLS